jgi:hypothetical protein
MNQVVFSQQSIFHLYRLGHIVHAKTGKRFQLSDLEQAMQLIRYCDRCKEPVIARQWRAFVGSCDEQVLDQLASNEAITVAG